MADKEILISVKTDTGNTNKEIAGVETSLKGANKEAANSAGNFDKLKTTLDNTNKAGKSTGGVFASLGSALKSLGIVTVIIAAFQTLKEAFMSNQKTADTVAAVFKTISTVTNELIGIFSKATDEVGKSGNGFAALKAVMDGLLTLTLTPLKFTFNGIKLVIQEAQLAWEDSFFGNKNKQKITDLNKAIGETKKDLVNNAVNAGVALKGVVTNFGEAVGSVAKVVSKTIDGASKLNVSNIYEQSKATIQLKNNAVLAAETLKGLVADYGRQAEKLRQLRDDDSNSVSDRIAANEQLGRVLKEQRKAMTEQADVSIEAARVELAANKTSVEAQRALISAQNERKNVLEQIAGFESEQLQNRNNLIKESANISKVTAESENKIYYERLRANAELIKDELKKQLTIKALNEQQAIDELQRLSNNIAAAKSGTQAKVDAQIAFNEKKKELDIQAAQSEKAIEDVKKARLDSNRDAQAANDLAVFAHKRSLLELGQMDNLTKSQMLLDIAKQEADEQIRIINEKKDAEVASAEALGLDTTAIKQKYALQVQIINDGIEKSEKGLSKAKIAATVEAADAAADSLMRVSQLLGEATGAGKALAVASTTISTFSAAQKAYESTMAIPVIGPFLAPINAAIAVASGLAQVKKILAVEVPGGGGGSTPTAASLPAPVTPQQQSTALNASTIQAVGNASGKVGEVFILDKTINDTKERAATLNRAARLG